VVLYHAYSAPRSTDGQVKVQSSASAASETELC